MKKLRTAILNRVTANRLKTVKHEYAWRVPAEYTFKGLKAAHDEAHQAVFFCNDEAEEQVVFAGVEDDSATDEQSSISD